MNTGGHQGERWVLPGLGRRGFLIGAAASAAALAAGCSSDDGGGSGETSTTRRGLGPTTTENVPKLNGDPFGLGVASGDPTASGVILWTRLAPEPLADDGSGGMPAEPADVIWEVATSEDFADVVAQGVATAVPEYGHSIHIDVPELAAATDYWYRFHVGTATSPVGRTRTLPDGSPDAFGLAVVNCQMYENGAYGAYRHLLDEDIQLVAHLGDYIYEYPGGEGEGRHSKPNAMLRSVGDYRLRYASYKVDPDLAAAHARFPWVVTWDDHEVANNYMGDTVPGDASAELVQERKAAAYQAWWENMPVRLEPPEGSELAVYRDFAVGDLARLYLLDERQYSDPTPCRDDTLVATDFGNCEEIDDERSRLGADQEAWLTSSLSGSDATWNLLGNPVALAGIDAGKDEPDYYLDLWDGYPDARQRLIGQLAGVTNPVVLTGDYHAGMVLDVHETPFDQDSPVVAPEFMAPAISSVLFADDVSARTPQQRTQINEHGYLTVAITPDELTATFRVLDDVQDPDTGISTASTWRVGAGNPVTEQV